LFYNFVYKNTKIAANKAFFLASDHIFAVRSYYIVSETIINDITTDALCAIRAARQGKDREE